MPVTKSAIKKARQDLKRSTGNKGFKNKLKSVIKNFSKTPTVENFKLAQSIIDQAVKKEVYKKNKAARLKSRLTRLIKEKIPKSAKIVKNKTKKSKRGTKNKSK